MDCRANYAVMIIGNRFLLSGILSGPRLTAGANTVDNENEILNLSSIKLDICANYSVIFLECEENDQMRIT